MDARTFESRALELFFKTGDRVTAQLAAYKIGCSVDEARTQLESMASREIVTLDSDDNGVLFFDLPHRPPPTGEPLSWHATATPPTRQVAMVPYPAPMIMMPAPMPVMIAPEREKSVAAAAILPMFFGPLGMIYSTIPGFLTMFFAGTLFIIMTFGVGALLVYPACIAWSTVAATTHNQRVRNQRQYLLDAQAHAHAQQVHHAQYAQRQLPR